MQVRVNSYKWPSVVDEWNPPQSDIYVVKVEHSQVIIGS